MTKILISGGSGFLGSHLIPYLQSKDHDVSILSRKIQPDTPTFLWDIEKQTIDPAAFHDTDAIIHLAGSGIASGRWTLEYKKEILNSRTQSAYLLYRELKKNPGHKVKTLIAASAIGYYGDPGNQWVDENFKGADDFMGRVCSEWEKSTSRFAELGIRVIILRIGLVLAPDGGVLPAISTPIRYCIGAPLGNGKQYMSWIHINDLIRMIAFILDEDKTNGIYNAVSPVPVMHDEFMKMLGIALNRPIWPFHIPEFILKTILGEKAVIVLNGQRVSSEKIRMAGFNFLHTDLKNSLIELTEKKS